MADWHRMWLAGTQIGLYQSADALTWEKVGIYTFRVTNIARDRGRTCLSVGPGLWEITKDPGRWAQLHDETLTEVLDLAWIPGDPGVVAASAYGVAVGARDELGAVRWSWRTDRLAVNERFANAVVVDPGDVHRWVVGTEAGVMVGEEDGLRWRHSGLMGIPVRAILHAMGSWWAGTDERGIWRSQDGLVWRRAGRGLDEGTVFRLRESRGRILAGTLEGVVVGDGEGRWCGMGPRAMITGLGVHPDEPSFWVAGAVPGGLWVTEDGGRRWQYRPALPSTVEAIIAPERRGS